MNWRVGELVSTWWRPNFETVMYPYVPPQVDAPKESRKIFLTQLPPTGILAVPKNLQLLAVPLFELFDNAHRYGPVIASLPQLLARVKFVYCDHNAQPLATPHITALQLTNIETYAAIQRRKEMKKIKAESNGQNGSNGMAVDTAPSRGSTVNSNVNAVNAVNAMMPNVNAVTVNAATVNGNHSGNSSGSDHSENVNASNPSHLSNASRNSMESVGRSPNQQIVIPNANPVIRQLNPLMNQYRGNQVGALFAQNVMMAQVQAQQQQQRMLLAQQLLRPRPFANARIIVTPSPSQPAQPPPQPQGNPPIMHGQMGHSALPHRTHPPTTGVPQNNHNMPRRPNQ